jgi:DNA-binding PadR family transcriptional regulator
MNPAIPFPKLHPSLDLEPTELLEAHLRTTIPSDDIVVPRAIHVRPPPVAYRKRGPVAKKTDTESFLPLTPAMFHILLALADGEKHGYAILKEVARRTDDKVRLSAGTLYGNLARLERAGLLAESSRRPEIVLDDERRRYYQLTELGRKVAVAEAERMQEAVTQARAKNLFKKPRLA